MAKHSLLVAVFVWAFGLTACKTTNHSSTLQSDGKLLFVGCVPSESECRYSCPKRDGKGAASTELCPLSEAPIACGCPADGHVSPTPPSSETHDFVACVPTANECRQSCQTRKIITFQGSDRCDKFEFACYCEKGIQ